LKEKVETVGAMKKTAIAEQGTYVQVNDLNLYYETHGTGIPVILLHGGMETSQMWQPLLPLFSDDYMLITPDSRAHGRTDNPSKKFSYALTAADIAGLIQVLDLQKPFVAGYSDGGQTALHMAMAYPGLARGYLVGGTYHRITPEWQETMQGPLGFDGPGKVDFERVLSTNPELVQTLQERHDIFHTAGYWKTYLTQISSQWMIPLNYSHADFAKIIDPLFFFCGDRDVFCPPEQNLEMYRMVRQAEMAVIPNADHFSIAQQFDVIATMMQGFMRRITVTA
jgi:pimeloyl-ACP methyl ester carboxylesterase